MNEFCAAMGVCNLRHLDDEIAKREQVDERYRERLGGTPGIKLIDHQAGVLSNHAYMPVVLMSNVLVQRAMMCSMPLRKRGLALGSISIRWLATTPAIAASIQVRPPL